MFLSLCTAYIFAFSHIGSLTYEAYSTKSNTYQQGTMIGSIDISGKSKEEALTIITKHVAEWQSNAIIELVYREKKLPFNNDSFTFNITESIDLAIDGQKNPLIVQLTKYELQKSIVLLAPSVTVTDDLENNLLQIAQSLSEVSELNINQYLTQEIPPEIISTIRVKTDIEIIGMEKLSEMVITGGATFSLTKVLSEKGIVDTTLSIYNLLSSGLYQLILPTNFTIQERHLGTELPQDIPLGFEAKLDNHLGWDFVFYNPNQDDFTVRISQQTGYVQFDLVGYPLVNKYEIEMKNEQTFSPKTIKRFDPLLLPGESKELESGKNGSYIEVYRKKVSSSGEWIGTELISKDFYAPQHRVELTGLVKNEIESNQSLDEESSDEITDIEMGTEPSSTEMIEEISKVGPLETDSKMEEGALSEEEAK